MEQNFIIKLSYSILYATSFQLPEPATSIQLNVYWNLLFQVRNWNINESWAVNDKDAIVDADRTFTKVNKSTSISKETKFMNNKSLRKQEKFVENCYCTFETLVTKVLYWINRKEHLILP